MWRWLTFVLILCSAATASAQEKISGWHTDLDSACQLARKTDKPLFVVFRCVR